ncbi:MAG: biotin--[acetyl-CoA-carboxylase] ligase [Alistipes sp.]|nr:biotin--[acetyl-CoA-carboxylase] ligase [Alistipes sp.]
MIRRIDETTSTNDELRSGDYAEGDIVWAERQTAGRGQRGHSWSSAEGLDLTFSVLLCPRFLPAAEQFSILRVVALALCETFAEYEIDTRIKWTNDIYVGDRKITGVLIENTLEGDRLSRSVIGIGINVNSTEFDPSLPNPTSMAAETGRIFDRGEVLGKFAVRLGYFYEMLVGGGGEALRREYDAQLYRLDEPSPFRLPDGTPFTAAIRGTEPAGRLIAELSDGSCKSFAFKELEFVLKK